MLLFSGDFHANAEGELSTITKKNLLASFGEFINLIEFRLFVFGHFHFDAEWIDDGHEGRRYVEMYRTPWLLGKKFNLKRG